MANDYYETLGVSRDASAAEIKKAFRKVAMECHPDRNQGDKKCEEQFKVANEAYSVLSDPQKKANYDQFGSAEGMGSQGHGGGFGGFDSSGFGDVFEDVFGDLFGAFGGRNSSRSVRGSDLRYDLDVTLDEAAFGVEKEISIPSWQECAECDGTGSKSKKQETCPDCKGTGQIRFQQGFFSVAKTCGKCRGEGKFVNDPCASCKGTGRIEIERNIAVKVPPGVDSGLRLKMSGEGEPGQRGGPSGDLYIVLDVAPHEIFRRKGQDIFMETVLTISQAVLGTELEVPTLDGSHKLKIPAGSQPGDLLRIKGKGLPRVGGRARGEQLCMLNVLIPKKVTAKQKELLKEFAKLGESDAGGGIKDKIKNMFAGTG